MNTKEERIGYLSSILKFINTHAVQNDNNLFELRNKLTDEISKEKFRIEDSSKNHYLNSLQTTMKKELSDHNSANGIRESTETFGAFVEAFREAIEDELYRINNP